MPLDDEARAQLVREWLRSPLKQTEFCAAHGISTRVLREWVRRFGAGGRPEVRALAIIDTAIAQLQALRAALVAEKACQNAGAESRGQPMTEETAAACRQQAADAEPAGSQDLAAPSMAPEAPAQVVAKAQPAGAMSAGGGASASPTTSSSLPGKKKSGFDWESEDEPETAPEPVVQAPVPPSPPAIPAPPAPATPLPMPAPGVSMLG